MSTRSAIIKQQADGSYLGIYCHNDGYPEAPHGVGHKLITHYTDEDKINELIALGDLSQLGDVVGEKHDFDWMRNEYAGADFDEIKADPRYDMTVAYHRDRGDERDINHGISAAAVARQIEGEFAYVHTTEGGWNILDDGGILTPIPTA